MEWLSAEALYIIGLVLVVMYLVVGLDDFIWDIVAIAKRANYRENLMNIQELNEVPPKLLAFTIAAWHEDNVLGSVIENIIESTHYPRSMYHIFLGVYPNDEPTVEAARALAAKYPNVHVVVNFKPGPTSKAQNINYVIQQIKVFERERNWKFASLTVHDSEDVVHPYELKVTSYLLDKHEALQFPLFPLIQMPKFSNFFKNLTTSTYADEFAENHFTTMVGRYQTGAFVPSAGTGFTLSRKTIDSFEDGEVLPSDSLTEDYRLALTLYEKGIQMYFVLEKLPRVSESGKIVWDFIATRSMFPTTLKTAIKQKTRWILGITMQSFKLKDVFRIKGLKLVGRYSMYKDLKAKVGNLAAFMGYPVFAYVVASMFVPLTPVYPMYSLSWYFSMLVTVMMAERQLFRAISIYNVYGLRSMFFAVLLPPVLPIRILWGNLINWVATVRAYKQSIFGTDKRQKSAKKVKKEKNKSTKKKFAWDKTHHYFLEKSVLKRYHRKLGDILLEKGYVSPDQLQSAIYATADTKQSLGGYFLQNGAITEHQLLTALSAVKHIQYFEIENLADYNLDELAPFFDQELLHKLLVAPLLKTETGFVIAFCDNSQAKAQTILREKYSISVHAVFASQDTVEQALERMFTKGRAYSLLLALSGIGTISRERADAAFDNERDAVEQALEAIYSTPIDAKSAYSLISTLYAIGITNIEQAVIANRYRRESIEEALERVRTIPVRLGGVRAYSRILALFADGIINYEQVIIAFNYKNTMNAPEEDILRNMGLLTSGDLSAEAVAEEEAPAEAIENGEIHEQRTA